MSGGAIILARSASRLEVDFFRESLEHHRRSFAGSIRPTIVGRPRRRSWVCSYRVDSSMVLGGPIR